MDDIASLFSLECDAKGCTELANFVCPKCSDFAYCSIRCRKRNHNFRKCTKSSDAMVAITTMQHKNMLSDLEVVLDGEVDSKQIDSMLNVTLGSGTSYKESAKTTLQIVREMTRYSPEQVSAIRAYTKSALSHLRFEWDKKTWGHLAMGYISCLKNTHNDNDLDTAIRSSEYVVKMYHKTSTTPDASYVYAQISLAWCLAEQVVRGIADLSERRHRIDATIEKAIATCQNHGLTMMETRAKFTEALIKRELSDGIIGDATVMFMMTCSKLYQDCQDHTVSSMIVHELCLSAIVLGQLNLVTGFCEYVMDPEKAVATFTAQKMIDLFLKVASITHPEKAEFIASTFFQTASIKDNPLCTASAYLAMARIRVDTDDAIKYYNAAFKRYQDMGMVFHAADTIFEMFCETEDVHVATDYARTFLATIAGIEFTSLTGFYYRSAFETVIKFLIHASYQDGRFDQAWKLAAAFCNMQRICDAWDHPGITDYRYYVMQSYIYKMRETANLWPDWCDKRIKSYAVRKDVPLLEYGARRTFGPVDGAHADFVDSVGLVNDDDEESFAFVSIQIAEEIYGFLVSVDGLLAVKHIPSSSGIESMARGIVRCINPEPDRDTTVAIVQHVDKPSGSLSGMLRGSVSCVWNA